MSFRDIRDQAVAVRLLQSLLRKSRIPSGLMLYGPSGVGKATTAVELAKAINCEQAQDDPCDACLSCRKIRSGNHPDVMTVVPIKKARIIDVEAIDDVVEAASLRPYEARWRVFLIHDADRMRPPAQNHLLKTLEEPLGRSLFILITAHPHWLLPTIRSRCQRVRFGALKPETVVALLHQAREIDDVTAASVAALSQGQMTRALDLVDSDRREIVLDLIRQLQEGVDPLALSEEFGKYRSGQRHQIESTLMEESTPDVKELSKEDRERIREEQMALTDALIRRDILEYLYLLETWFRDVLVYQTTGSADAVFNRDQVALLQQASADTPDAKIAAVERARVYLERFLNEERVFRDLFFALAP